MNFHQTLLLIIIVGCLGMLTRGINNGLKSTPTVVSSNTQVITTNPLGQSSSNSNQNTYQPDADDQNIEVPPAVIINKDPTLLEKAHRFAYNGGITSFSTLEGFQPQEPLSREWAAKMFTQFAKLVDQEEYFKRVDSFAKCNFTDKADITPLFFRDTVEACYTNIMAGENGYFMPKLHLTHEQANIMIWRITKIPNSTGSSLPISRGGLIEMMMDAYALKKAQMNP